MTLVEADTLAPMPWKNGGGRTRELFVWPSAEAWRLRLSLADIEQNGPFSAFPGVQRHFAVLEGAGVRLHFAEGDRVLRAGDAPLAFEGADAPGCTLLAGATRDLNLMLRGLGGALHAAADGECAPSAPWCALFCAGAAQLGAQNLPPRSLLLNPPAGAALHRRDGAPAFWITVDQPLMTLPRSTSPAW